MGPRSDWFRPVMAELLTSAYCCSTPGLNVGADRITEGQTCPVFSHRLLIMNRFKPGRRMRSMEAMRNRSLWPVSFWHVAERASGDHLNALEHAVYANAIAASQFKAILNEKDPPAPTVQIEIPPSFRMRIVSDEVAKIRSHPDFRIARRSQILSRLAQVISERKVQGGLRRVLLTQAKRLQWLADRRYHALGGAASVEMETGEEGDND